MGGVDLTGIYRLIYGRGAFDIYRLIYVLTGIYRWGGVDLTGIYRLIYGRGGFDRYL